MHLSEKTETLILLFAFFSSFLIHSKLVYKNFKKRGTIEHSFRRHTMFFKGDFCTHMGIVGPFLSCEPEADWHKGTM